MNKIKDILNRLDVVWTGYGWNPSIGGLGGWVYLLGNDIIIIERIADVLLNTCKYIGLAVNTGQTNTWK